MAETGQDDEFYSENARVLKFTLTDKDNADVPLVLAGLTIQWVMAEFNKNGEHKDTYILRKDNGVLGGVAITNSSGGLCEVTISKTDIVGISGDFYHELEVIDSLGDPVVNATGTLTILKNVKNV